MLLTEEQIQQINKECTYNQGIFKEPYGIPVHIKEHVLYNRYETGGVSGGSCWDSSNPQRYTNNDKQEFEVIDKVLKILRPNITYLEFKMLSGLIHTNEETEWEYYGNSTDYKIEYIILSELEKALLMLD